MGTALEGTAGNVLESGFTTVRNLGVSPVRIGIMGCGYWGPNLIRNFAKFRNCEVIAVADIEPEKLASVQWRYPQVQGYASGEELIKGARVNAVAIATPVSTHYALAKSALEQGVNVLLEKPMAATVSEARELIGLAKERQAVLMVDHTFVFAGAVRTIRELIENGELGDIYYYDSVRVNLGLFQNDVDVLWDLGPHDFSIMTHLLAKDVASVSAIGAKPVRRDHWEPESIVYVAVRFADGTLAHLHLNWLSPVKIRRTLIGGSRKMVVYDHLDPDNQVKIFDRGVDLKTEPDRSEILVQYRMGDMFAPKVDQTEALEAVCAHFLECVEGGREPITNGWTGLEVVRLLQAAEASLKRHGEFVPLAHLTKVPHEP